MEGLFAIIVRIFAGAAFCFFAFAPAWVGFGVLAQIIVKPSELDLFAIAVLVVCFSLLYFFLLLAYRAFTGRGRKADGGLLPSWGMKSFVAAYGVMAVLIIAFAAYNGKLNGVLGGSLNLFIALSVYRLLKWRESQHRFNA
ncbi:hypothetical protein [Dokdonella fugitiva]|jgi:uncharacterized membrane protein (DUF373 family)|uniref:hypothetical protein n=1 Tax=Dokdonella fugitiva TaxID=328517 RepID=UPI0015F7B5C3|nr:hypothetical protein [Dokdonella fugitiva]MBA8885776.1 uncharacterized membrane protein (DUF373 family) [Dokdonella fugitiva]